MFCLKVMIFSLEPGMLTLIPQGGNPGLTFSGTRLIEVSAPGYATASVEQNILPGSLSEEKSIAYSESNLFRGVRTDIVAGGVRYLREPRKRT